MENIEKDEIAFFLKQCLSVFPITVLHPVLILFVTQNETLFMQPLPDPRMDAF